MRKNQHGFGIVAYVLLTLFVIISIVGWRLYQRQKSVASENAKPKFSAAKTSSTNKLTTNPEQNTLTKDYPKPTTPTALKVTPAGTGYKLTWEASVSSSAIAKYQVFYQGNLIAEPSTTSYQHNLPPPTPGCKPIALTYYVKAVDSNGNLSDPSNSVTLQFGGC